MTEYQTKLVDAIEEGRIVRVSEDYARRENLVVLRKPELTPSEERKTLSSGTSPTRMASRTKKELFAIDKFRRPLRNDNNVFVTLKDNFHWEIANSRKHLNLGRRQAAQRIGCTEEELKMLENGVLPGDDYVLINKVQNFYKINLRKDGQDFISSARQRVEEKIKTDIKKKETMEEKEERKNEENILGKESDIIDNE